MTTLPRFAAAAAIALGVIGCDVLLTVSNPGTLQEEQLTDPALEQFLINGAIGEFQFAYGIYVFWSGVLSDEVFTDHPNTHFRALSQHNFDDLNGSNEVVYGSLQRARQSAEDATARIKTMHGANATSNLNVARAHIYGGYSYLLLGEGFCESPVNLSAALPSTELLTRAIARFDEGITVAIAAGTGADAVAAQELIYMAQVGAARAALWMGDLVRARAYAESVPVTHERWAHYSANSVRENNALAMGVRQQIPYVGMHPVFQGRNDPRVSQPSAARMSLSANLIFPPLKPSMYSGWSGTGAAQTIEVNTHIRIASGLEARYIVAEADGPGAAMLDFVNGRRAAGGKPQVNLSGPALVEEFRVQRSRDFYLTGRRLGDLRRYAATGTDLFPTGNHPVGSGSYGSMHCFIVPYSEKSGNPNYRPGGSP